MKQLLLKMKENVNTNHKFELTKPEKISKIHIYLKKQIDIKTAADNKKFNTRVTQTLVL